jgi:hypothetical protein
VTVNYILALFYGELRKEFELSQQNFVKSDFVLKRQNKRVSVGVDGTAQYRLLLFSLQISNKLATEYKLILLNTPQSSIPSSTQNAVSLAS